jgi:hypothetical protein
VRSESENFVLLGYFELQQRWWVDRSEEEEEDLQRKKGRFAEDFAHLCVFMVDFGRLGARIFGGIFGNDYNPARGECGAFGHGVV